MIYNSAIFEVTKTWDVRRRVLRHAMLHQLALMEWVFEPEHPLINEYKLFSYDAVSGFLHGNTASCLTDINVADAALDALLRAINDSLDVEIGKQHRFNGGQESFVTRTFLVMSAVLANHIFPEIPEEDISDYFEDITLQDTEHAVFSTKLAKMAVALGEQGVDTLSSFLQADPNIAKDYREIMHDLGDRDNEPFIEPAEPRYHITDHDLAKQALIRIGDGEDMAILPQGSITSSFNPIPPYNTDPKDPSVYYVRKISHMFKVIDQRYSVNDGDIKAIQFSIRAWLRLSIQYFYEGNAVRALYIASAVLIGFAKGLSAGPMADVLRTDADFLDKVRYHLADALLLTIHYMEFVPSDVYAKVRKRMLRYQRSYSGIEPRLVNLSPFIDYYTARKTDIDESMN